MLAAKRRGINLEGKTHILGGVAAGAYYLYSGGTVEQEVLFFGGLMFGAMIPDIDHTGSKIGRAVPLLDDIISTVFGHRTFTHSLLFLILASLLFHWASWPESFEFGIIMGMLSHVLLDMLTKDGIKFLWPFPVTVRIPFGISTGGIFEQGFYTMLIVFIGYYGYQIYF